jgi:hypothetical protein
MRAEAGRWEEKSGRKVSVEDRKGQTEAALDHTDDTDTDAAITAAAAAGLCGATANCLRVLLWCWCCCWWWCCSCLLVLMVMLL